MKFLPEQKKKQIWSVGLLAVSIIGIVYFNFFSGPPKVELVSPEQIRKNMGTTSADTAPAAANPSSTASHGAKLVVKKFQGGILPYGTGIETAIIEQDKFKALVPGAAISVSEAELGKDDLFGK